MPEPCAVENGGPGQTRDFGLRCRRSGLGQILDDVRTPRAENPLGSMVTRATPQSVRMIGRCIAKCLGAVHSESPPGKRCERRRSQCRTGRAGAARQSLARGMRLLSPSTCDYHLRAGRPPFALHWSVCCPHWSSALARGDDNRRTAWFRKGSIPFSVDDRTR